MKEFKKCTLIVAMLPGEGYLDENQCEFEHEVSNETILSLHVVPLPPIYKFKSRMVEERKSVVFLSYHELKIAS